jgi:hypothetical protein
LERNLKIDDRIIRFLSVKTGENVNVEALQMEIAAKAKPPVETAATPEPETEEVSSQPVTEAAAASTEAAPAAEPEKSLEE